MGDIAAAKPTAGAPIDTAWGQQMHDAVEGIQYGSIATSLSSATVSGVVTITFPRPYAVPPAVILTPIAAGGLFHADMETAPTTTGVAVRSAYRDNTAVSASVPIHWIAIGVLA